MAIDFFMAVKVKNKSDDKDRFNHYK